MHVRCDAYLLPCLVLHMMLNWGVKCDITVAQAVSRTLFYPYSHNTSTYWFAYVQAYLYKTMDLVRHFHLSQGRKELLHTSITWFADRQIYTSQYEMTKVLKRPNGFASAFHQILLLCNGSQHYRDDRGSKKSEELFRVLFNRHLAMNLTFLEIKVPAHIPQKCQSSYFSVATENTMFKFCGHQENVDIYPHGPNISIGLTSFGAGNFYFSLLYRVLDKNIIRSCSKNFEKDQEELKLESDNYTVKNSENFAELRKSSLTPLKTIFKRPADIFLKHRHLSEVYWLMTDKVRVFTLNLSMPTVQVHNGPGLQSPRVYPTNKYGYLFNITTFQCIIWLILAFTFKPECLSTEYHHTYLILAYTTELAHVQRKLLVSDTFTLQLIPSVINNSTFVSTVTLQVTGDHHINATFILTEYTGVESYFCLFGGMAAAEPKTDMNTLSFCGVESLGRSVYSKSSELFLIFYSYNQYSKTAMTLRVSLTKCKAIVVDLCIFYQECVASSFEVFFRQFSQCSEYLRFLSNPKQQSEFVSIDDLYLAHYLKGNTCSVIQIGSVSGQTVDSGLCLAVLLPTEVKNSNTQITQEQVRGTLISSVFSNYCVKMSKERTTLCKNENPHDSSFISRMSNKRSSGQIHHSLFLSTQPNSSIGLVYFPQFVVLALSKSWVEFTFVLSDKYNNLADFSNTYLPDHSWCQCKMPSQKELSFLLSVAPHKKLNAQLLHMNMTSYAVLPPRFRPKDTLLSFVFDLNTLYALTYSASVAFPSDTAWFHTALPGHCLSTQTQFSVPVLLSAKWVLHKDIYYLPNHVAFECPSVVPSSIHSYCLNYSSFEHEESHQYYLLFGRTEQLPLLFCKERLTREEQILGGGSHSLPTPWG